MSDDHNRAVDVLQGFERWPRALFIVGPRVVERQIRRDGVMPAGAETLYQRRPTRSVVPVAVDQAERCHVIAIASRACQSMASRLAGRRTLRTSRGMPIRRGRTAL